MAQRRVGQGEVAADKRREVVAGLNSLSPTSRGAKEAINGRRQACGHNVEGHGG